MAFSLPSPAERTHKRGPAGMGRLRSRSCPANRSVDDRLRSTCASTMPLAQRTVDSFARFEQDRVGHVVLPSFEGDPLQRGPSILLPNSRDSPCACQSADGFWMVVIGGPDQRSWPTAIQFIWISTGLDQSMISSARPFLAVWCRCGMSISCGLAMGHIEINDEK